MTVACYYCNTVIPSDKAKRCARCRLVTYCSKDCQKISWKMTHKNNCVPHPTVAALNGEKPEKFSQEWVELEVDKLLSNWIAEWRTCFIRWTKIALNLANHPPDRVVTHCLHLVVEPRHFQSRTYRNYHVIKAEVLPLSQVKETHPDLVTEVDPSDLTRLRFVVTLQNEQGEIRRVRLLQWNDLGISSWRAMPKSSSADLAEGFAEALMYSVEQLTLDAVQKNLGLK